MLKYKSHQSVKCVSDRFIFVYYIECIILMSFIEVYYILWCYILIIINILKIKKMKKTHFIYYIYIYTMIKRKTWWCSTIMIMIMMMTDENKKSTSNCLFKLLTLKLIHILFYHRYSNLIYIEFTKIKQTLFLENREFYKRVFKDYLFVKPSRVWRTFKKPAQT